MSRRRATSFAFATVLLLAAAACSLTAPPVDDVQALAEFRAAPEDRAAAMRATHALFQTADLTVQEALVGAANELDHPATPAAILAAEAELPAAVRDRVLGLATAGAEAAEAVLAAPGPSETTTRVDAEVHLALHLTFVAWANGPMRSLMAGYGTRILAAMDRALALDPLWDNGAPLRLKGRFLAQAPWPVGDRDAALELLQRAVAHAPLPIHHLFLGDLLFQRGDTAAATEQWRAVLTSSPDATTAAAAPWHRRMAEHRLSVGGR
ncbi:MAG: hypothetical protein KDE27_16095 [Planctomycetes bacterium]|nr:hypothetical protein [Planctomycetota bacterium]